MNLIYLHGGIGDAVMHSALVSKIVKTWPIKWEIYTDKLKVLKFFTGINAKSNQMYEKDIKEKEVQLRIDLDTFAVVSGKSFDRHENAILTANKSFIKIHQLEHYLSLRPIKDNVASELMGELGYDRRTLPFAMLDLPYEPLKIQKHESLHWLKEKYITIHDGVDIHHYGATTRATKTWDLGHWNKLLKEIKKQYGFKVVQIGTRKMAREIREANYHIFDADLIEVFRILANSEFHIDGESGMVHAAHALGTKSIVLFGPTPISYFGYNDNINIAPTFCKPCWWYDDQWTRRCPRGYDTPRCMDSITPEMVLKRINL